MENKIQFWIIYLIFILKKLKEKPKTKTIQFKNILNL